MNEIKLLEDKRALVIKLNEKYEFVSTLPFQPRYSNAIAFIEVKDLKCCNLMQEYEEIRRSLDLGESIIFITAASVKDYLKIDIEDWATIIVTMGLKHPACPCERSSYHQPLTGTVNILALVDKDLTFSSMLDLMRVIVEAKSLAFSEILLRCELRASGTITDAIVIGRPTRYIGSLLTAGMTTNIGGPIAHALYKALIDKGLTKIDLLYNTLGLRTEELLELITKAYSEAPIPGVSLDVIKDKAREKLSRILKDPNVMSILIAAREIDLHGAAGSIPGISREDFAKDSKAIIADELLAFSLSLYLSGFKGLLATYWIERLKEKGAFKINLPVFEDDVLSALIGSILSSIYDELIESK